MIYRCTSCQHETPAGLPPKPAKPDACEKCGGAVTGIHDTLPPPGEAAGATPPDELPSDDAQPRGGKRPKLLISTMLYSLSHELGHDAAVAELHRQVEELAGPFTGERNPQDFLPVAYTIARAMRVFDVGLFVDAGATQIGKCRSRAMAHAMKHPEFEVWLSVDDDVEATLPTLVALYDACSGGAPSIAIAPCFLRGRPLVNVAFPQVVVERKLVGSSAKLRTALYGGFGLVAMSQQALKRIDCDWFIDDDGEHKPAAFADIIVDAEQTGDDWAGKKIWFGEDLSFFLRVPRSVRVEALLTGYTRHAGETLNLARVDDYETMKATDAWLGARGEPETTERKVHQPEVPAVDAPAPASTFTPSVPQGPAVVPGPDGFPEVESVVDGA
jgi:hypothetical protein